MEEPAKLERELAALLGPFDVLSDDDLGALVALSGQLCGELGSRTTLDTLLVIVEQMADFLEDNGAYTEGIFRLSASSSTIVALTAVLLFRPDKISSKLLARAGPVAVACTLKRLIANAGPTTVLSLDMAHKDLAQAVASLDAVAAAVLHRLVLLLNRLANAPATKLSASSLAVCIGPSLFGDAVELGNPLEAAAVFQTMHQLLEKILNRADELFPHAYQRRGPPLPTTSAPQKPRSFGIRVLGTVPVANQKRSFLLFITESSSEGRVSVSLKPRQAFSTLQSKLAAQYTEEVAPRLSKVKPWTRHTASWVSEQVAELQAFCDALNALPNVGAVPAVHHFITSTASDTYDPDESLPSLPFAKTDAKHTCPVCHMQCESDAELLSHLEFSDCKHGPVSSPKASVGDTSPTKLSPRQKISEILSRSSGAFDSDAGGGGGGGEKSPRGGSEKSPRGFKLALRSPRASRDNFDDSGAFPGVPLRTDLSPRGVDGGSGSGSHKAPLPSPRQKFGIMSRSSSGIKKHAASPPQSPPQSPQRSPPQSPRGVSPTSINSSNSPRDSAAVGTRKPPPPNFSPRAANSQCRTCGAVIEDAHLLEEHVSACKPPPLPPKRTKDRYGEDK